MGGCEETGMATMVAARTINDLTAGWLSWALERPVRSVRAAVVGTGQLGRVVRLELELDDGAEDVLIAKLAAENETSRQTGIAMGVYQAEVRFYDEIASTVAIDVPRCHFAAYEPETGWFTLIFDDASAEAQV